MRSPISVGNVGLVPNERAFTTEVVEFLLLGEVHPHILREKKLRRKLSKRAREGGWEGGSRAIGSEHGGGGGLTRDSPFWKRLDMSMAGSEGFLGEKNLEAKYQKTAIRMIPVRLNPPCSRRCGCCSPPPPAAAAPPPPPAAAGGAILSFGGGGRVIDG